MRIDYLRYLVEIDRYHSISAAAQKLYLSQATLSAILKGVEEELGFPVFERRRSGVYATVEGEEALSLILEILSCCDEIETLRERSGPRRPVSVLLSPILNAALGLPLNAAFMAREPEGNLEFRTFQGDEIGGQILNNESNIGLSYFAKHDLEAFQEIAAKYQVEVEPLRWDRLCLVVRRDHPLAGREDAPPEVLHDLDFAILEHFSIRENSIAYVPRMGSGNRYTVFPGVAQIRRAVLEEGMVTILSDYTFAYGFQTGEGALKALPLVESRRENLAALCLMHRGEQNIRREEQAAVDCIRSYFEELS